jgi:LytS/YehU family sensor histidine kinase
MHKNTLIAFLVLLLTWVGATSYAQNNDFNVDFWANLNFDEIKGKTFTREELVVVFDQVDISDYIRTNQQRQEIIEYLLVQCHNLNYNQGVAKCSNILGVLARDRSEYAKAIEWHELALNQSGNDTITTIYALNNLGVVYRRLDQPRVALDFHIKALNLAETFNSLPKVRDRSICIALNSIGNINLTLNQPNKALEVFNQSLQMEIINNNNLGIAINLQNIGYAYQASNELDSALFYYQQSLHYNEKINSIVGLAICNNSIGNILLIQGQSNEAMEHFNKALALSRTTHDVYYIAQAHANLGRALLAQNRTTEAYEQISEFNELARQIKSGMLIRDSHALLSEYYEKAMDYGLALRHLKTASQVADSIVNEKNTRYLNELQTIYEAQKREQQIDLLTAKNRIKNQQVFIALIGLFMTILVVAFLVFIQQKKSAAKQTALENRLFRSQMNPHFIFNALGSIQSFMYNNEPRKAAEYLGLYSSLTRSVLNSSNIELVTLEEELATLKNYIELEKMRLGSGFDYQINIDPEVEIDFTHVPPIILQPFVENAIHHGLKNRGDQQGKLTIDISQEKEHVCIHIIDNGPGFIATKSAQHQKLHESMGLKIFEQRIALIRKKYKKTVNFAMVDFSEEGQGQQGTKIVIEFPMIYPND